MARLARLSKGTYLRRKSDQAVFEIVFANESVLQRGHAGYKLRNIANERKHWTGHARIEKDYEVIERA